MSNLDIFIEMMRLAEQMGDVDLCMTCGGNVTIYVTLRDGTEVKLSLEPRFGGDEK